MSNIEILKLYRRYIKIVGHLNAAIENIDLCRTDLGTSNYEIDLELLRVVKNKYLVLETGIVEVIKGLPNVDSLNAEIHSTEIRNCENVEDLMRLGYTEKEGVYIMLCRLGKNNPIIRKSKKNNKW